MPSEYYIAGDWGTSHLRLYLCEYTSTPEGSQILDTRTGLGVSAIAKHKRIDFETEFFNLTQDWLIDYQIQRVLLSGMVGSNMGWQTTPYSACPTSAHTISRQSLQFKCRALPFTIISGLDCTNPLGQYDIMRGEELQILGWLQQQSPALGRRLIGLPGTHNKWALVQDDRIILFMTTFTGELFALLSEHSVLVMVEQDTIEPTSIAFTAALDLCLSDTEPDLLQTLFTTRAQQIKRFLDARQARAYLSGLIIGSDVRGAFKLFTQYFDNHEKIPVTLIGETKLCAYYAQVFARYNRVELSHSPATQAAKFGFDAVYRHLR